MGERSAARADLHHVDHRDRNRHPRPLLEAVGAGDFEHAGGFGGAVADQADLGRGAAHVIADDLLKPKARGHIGGKDRAAGRTGFHQTHRKSRRGLYRDQTAARVDHEHRAYRPHSGQTFLQPGQVRSHLRPDIGVRADGVEPFEFPHLWRDFVRNRHRQIEHLFQDFARADFVRGVGVGMNQADGDRAEILLPDPRGNLAQRVFVQRSQNLSLRADPARDGEPILTRDQGFGQPDVQIVLREPVFGPHFDHVAKPFGRDQGGARAAPFDQRIGGQRRAMNDDVDLGQGNARRFGHNGDPVEDRLFRRGVVGQNLGRIELPADVKRDVGERAADIGAQTDVLRLAHEMSFVGGNRARAHVAPAIGAPRHARAKSTKHQRWTSFSCPSGQVSPPAPSPG